MNLFVSIRVECKSAVCLTASARMAIKPAVLSMVLPSMVGLLAEALKRLSL